MTKDIKCAMVYGAIATTPTGGFYSCCRMKMLEKYHGDLDNYWESAYVKKHKDMMSKGEWPEECIRCQKEEEIGHESKRIRENRVWLNKGNHWEDLEKNKTLYRIDLRFSNLCNLACVMCEPGSSSLIYDETAKNIENAPQHYTQVFHRFNKDNKKSYTDEDVDKLIEMIEPNTNVYITGGEPSLLKPVYKLLERLIEKGYNETIDLQFNSNFQTHNPRFIELIKQFKGLMMPSIDAVGDVAEFCRYPCNWNNVSNNVKAYLKECPHWRTKIYVTPSVMNIFDMKNIFKWRDNSLRPIISPGHNFTISTENTLNWPYYFNLKVLPNKYKDLVINEVNSILNNFDLYQSEISDLKFLKNKLLAYKNNNADDIDMLDKTFEELNKFDRLRNTDWRKVLPILHNIEKDYLNG